MTTITDRPDLRFQRIASTQLDRAEECSGCGRPLRKRPTAFLGMTGSYCTKRCGTQHAEEMHDAARDAAAVASAPTPTVAPIALIAPTVHLNGTAKGDLLEQLETAQHALRAAREALAQANPNARDYYVQGADAYGRARAAQEARHDRLRLVEEELCDLWHAVYAQGRR